MCLLAFLSAGETPEKGRKYRSEVERGLAYLDSLIKPDGRFRTARSMYSHAVVTLALCEAADRTKSQERKAIAAKAVAVIVKEQSDDGGWSSNPGELGDASVVGWQIQALKAARLAGIAVPVETLQNANKFLDGVSGDGGATYGYRTDFPRRSTTAAGLLCRMYTSWTLRKPAVTAGAEWLVENHPPTEGDLDTYYLYHATLFLHLYDGRLWHAEWNPKLQRVLLKSQVTQNTPGANADAIGSWPKATTGPNSGRLDTTVLACLTLQVYYRPVWMYRRNTGLAVIDK